MKIIVIIVIVSIASLTLVASARAQTGSVTLGIGQGVNFASGQVVTKVNEADLAFKYVPPQPGGGSMVWVPYGSGGGQLEYRTNVPTYANVPLLEAAKTGSFESLPDLKKITTGDVNRWTEDEYDLRPGRHLIVRGATNNKHYLLKITHFKAPTNNPKTWRISFTYKAIELPLGAAGEGPSFALSGVLTFRDRFESQKIVDLDLATGRLTERFDGFAPSRGPRGETLYLDNAGRIVIVDASGRTEATIRVEGEVGEAVLSPDGTKIAYKGYAIHTYVITRDGGRSVADFDARWYPAWTPDNRLVVCGWQPDYSDRGSPGLFISDRELKSLKRFDPNLKNPAHPAISPDGKRIAFTSNKRIWIMNLDGTELRQLTDSGLEEMFPVWSPDGQFIAFRMVERSTAVRYQITVARVAGGKLVSVVDALGRKHDPSSRISWR